MLFLASKIEEEPVKLRYLVNHCLGKWDPSALTWDPEGVDKQVQLSLFYFVCQAYTKQKQHQSRQYQQWERDILATEEIVLETLCFDMGVNQPWIILQRGVRGLDTFLAGLDDKTNGEFEAESSEQAAARHSKIDRTNGHDKLDEEVTLSEQLIIDLGWSILNNAYVRRFPHERRQCPLSYVSPLPVLHPSAVIAFVVFVLVVACLEEIPFSQARAAAAEFGPSFGLDIDFDETSGAAGSDADEVDGGFCSVPQRREAHGRQNVPDNSYSTAKTTSSMMAVHWLCLLSVSVLADYSMLTITRSILKRILPINHIGVGSQGPQ